jgi:predicted amino acid racemase
MQRAIAIDMEEAKGLHRSGIRVGHVGHLGQVPRSEAAYVLQTLSPDVITVYNLDKAKQVSDAAKDLGVEQKILFKVRGANDISYPTPPSAEAYPSANSCPPCVGSHRSRTSCPPA